MKKTILVVEDRENWRRSFCRLLEDMGYNVMEARYGSEFKEKLLLPMQYCLILLFPWKKTVKK
jgi:DNA-binding NtrC family response regulator